jgi:hypothetical protein
MAVHQYNETVKQLPTLTLSSWVHNLKDKNKMLTGKNITKTLLKETYNTDGDLILTQCQMTITSS